MSSKNIVERINDVYKSLERRKIIAKTPNYVYDYHGDYPKLKLLEDNYEVIRKECENILTFHNDITYLEELMSYTKGGIHAIQWKSFMFKSGVFVKENCELCPKTTELIKQIPGVRTAFFSILGPDQYITPHKGYYYGFMRYHLGVIIPYNNEENKCWLRIGKDQIAKAALPKEGDKYYWKNGEGILFNDNYTHDASNESDQIRVVLFLDIERKLPFLISLFNKLILNIAYSRKEVKDIAKNAVLKREPN